MAFVPDTMDPMDCDITRFGTNGSSGQPCTMAWSVTGMLLSDLKFGKP